MHVHIPKDETNSSTYNNEKEVRVCCYQFSYFISIPVYLTFLRFETKLANRWVAYDDVFEHVLTKHVRAKDGVEYVSYYQYQTCSAHH